MIVGGLAFGQTRLAPAPNQTNPNPGTPVSIPTSGGSTLSGGGGSEDDTFDLEDLVDLLDGALEAVIAFTEDEDE